MPDLHETNNDEREASSFNDRLNDYTRTLDCVHCGLCIPHCPTYEETLRESDSPRGRIYLLRHYAESGLELTDAVEKHLDQCIVCRACETACPSGVRMGALMEGFRAERYATRGRGAGAWVGRQLLRHVIAHPGRVALATDVLYIAQKLGLSKLARWTSKTLLRSSRLDAAHALEPRVPPPSERRLPRAGEVFRARGATRVRVGLFLGCIAAEWFAATHRATIRVLQRNGCDVVIVRNQTCCGALHRHFGMAEDATRLYDANASAFAKSDVDAVVVNAAGCGAALKEPPHDACDSDSRPQENGAPVTSHRQSLADGTRDICEFLDEIGIEAPHGSIDSTVVYDEPCHLHHAQGVRAGVVHDLLKAIPGLKLQPLAGSDDCCGSGGVYNLVHTEMAAAIGSRKAEAIRASGATVVATGNPGCAMQIRSALAAIGYSAAVRHPIELLDESYERQEAGRV